MTRDWLAVGNMGMSTINRGAQAMRYLLIASLLLTTPSIAAASCWTLLNSGANNYTYSLFMRCQEQERQREEQQEQYAKDQARQQEQLQELQRQQQLLLEMLRQQQGRR